MFGPVREAATGFDRLGVSVKSLAKTAAHRMTECCNPMHSRRLILADQPLPPFALAGGGSFATMKPGEHARTAASVIERFTAQRWVLAATSCNRPA